MRPFVVHPLNRLRGEFSPIGDKSIAHRAIIISSLADGRTKIQNFPANEDCLATVKAFRQLGVKIEYKKEQGGNGEVLVFGNGINHLTQPRKPIIIGDSGTTLRLILGVLAGLNLTVELKTGISLSKRPMLRVTKPLRLMGAKIRARGKKQGNITEEYPPIIIKGGSLSGITYIQPVASAQVKSAILLAGLYANGSTCVIEPIATRDHTERMLKAFKANIKVIKNKIVIKKTKKIHSPKVLFVPGDISSAAFFVVLASIIPNSKICIRNVSLNPTRLGLINILRRMGADIKISKKRNKASKFEPIGDIKIRDSILRGTIVKKSEIPSLIDELPIIMVASCFALGRTRLEGVGELRVKETDRIRSMSKNLNKMGADIRVMNRKKEEDILIFGKGKLTGSCVESFRDHRTAMSMIVAGSAASGKTYLDDISCINKSFPQFLQILNLLKSKIY